MNRKTRHQAQKQIKKLHSKKTSELKFWDKELAYMVENSDLYSQELIDKTKERIKKLGEEIIELEKDFDNFEEQGRRNAYNKTLYTLKPRVSLGSGLYVEGADFARLNDAPKQNNSSLENKVATQLHTS